MLWQIKNRYLRMAAALVVIPLSFTLLLFLSTIMAMINAGQSFYRTFRHESFNRYDFVMAAALLTGKDRPKLDDL